MKKVINGKRYNTEAADLIYEAAADNGWEKLYQKRTGEFFLHYYDRWKGGEGLRPLSYSDAVAWSAVRMPPDERDRLFRATDDGRVSVNLSLPKTAVAKLKRLAAMTGRRQSDLVAEMIMTTPESDKE